MKFSIFHNLAHQSAANAKLANESFVKLQDSLTETEQRIALARSYFNEIATGYNNCLEVVPDRFVATLASLQQQPLFAAADFERAPVSVDLD